MKRSRESFSSTASGHQFLIYPRPVNDATTNSKTQERYDLHTKFATYYNRVSELDCAVTYPRRSREVSP